MQYLIKKNITGKYNILWYIDGKFYLSYFFI